MSLRAAGLRLFSTTITPAAVGVVEEVVGQQDHAVDQIVIDEPLADVALLVLVLRARAARDRAGVEHDRRAAMIVQTGERVLEPGPIALAGGDAARGAEAVERIVGEYVGVERLVPHRIGDDDVVASAPCRRRRGTSD